MQRAMIEFALEGYLGHPLRGGNRDGLVWKALALEIPGFRT
jgi:hypothetical protein